MRCESFDGVECTFVACAYLGSRGEWFHILFYVCVMPMSCALLLNSLEKGARDAKVSRRFIVFD